eukprot:TRINITY_DN2107_c0_g1_i1.p1 TRINITY_DN2107_c0_g1~~TRINITY_DN2107_c0_g1_i1.p1  ORF type:complete len:401 (-),score=31.07 TRINITY_DN2107_c0_g1_i1:302-1504(-)
MIQFLVLCAASALAQQKLSSLEYSQHSMELNVQNNNGVIENIDYNFYQDYDYYDYFDKQPYVKSVFQQDTWDYNDLHYNDFHNQNNEQKYQNKNDEYMIEYNYMQQQNKNTRNKYEDYNEYQNNQLQFSLEQQIQMEEFDSYGNSVMEFVYSDEYGQDQSWYFTDVVNDYDDSQVPKNIPFMQGSDKNIHDDTQKFSLQNNYHHLFGYDYVADYDFLEYFIFNEKDPKNYEDYYYQSMDQYLTQNFGSEDIFPRGQQNFWSDVEQDESNNQKFIQVERNIDKIDQFGKDFEQKQFIQTVHKMIQDAVEELEDMRQQEQKMVNYTLINLKLQKELCYLIILSVTALCVLVIYLCRPTGEIDDGQESLEMVIKHKNENRVNEKQDEQEKQLLVGRKISQLPA